MARAACLAPSVGHRSGRNISSWGPIRTFPPPMRSWSSSRVWHHSRLALLFSFRLDGSRLRCPHHRRRVSYIFFFMKFDALVPYIVPRHRRLFIFF